MNDERDLETRQAAHEDHAVWLSSAMKVIDVMGRDVTTVGEQDTLGVAHRSMLRHGIRHLPVVRVGRLVGLLSERNLLAHLSKVESPEDCTSAKYFGQEATFIKRRFMVLA